MKKISWLRLLAVAVLSFAAGSLFTRIQEVRAQSNRVFELRVYHVNPGKLDALRTHFREHTLPMFRKYHITGIGFWDPQDQPESENTWIYIVAHPNREEAKKNWAAFQADPQWQKESKAANGDGQLVNKIDSTFMDPFEFSPLK
jgi:hypothetical protein